MLEKWAAIIKECRQLSEKTGAPLPALFTDKKVSGEPVGRHLADATLLNGIMMNAMFDFLQDVNARLEIAVKDRNVDRGKLVQRKS
ncbi:MAG: hypothetical protein C4589_00210 [Peptococcaceae bacterium]|jgi:hypothetical protein|nr:MAG: hypothetical protein C4589_00210 [Peptococcaceae bacterium]